MHELSLCNAIIETLQQEAEAHNYQRVTRVRLEIGVLATVDVQALRFAFDIASEKTLAQGALLDIISLPATARCQQCNRISELTERFDSCPHCNSYSLVPLSGEEMRIRDLEVQ